MLHYEPYSGPERRARDRIEGMLFRRRQQQTVENDRRRNLQGTAEIALALEMHIEEHKTRHAMVRLLQSWLAEARDSGPDAQDPDYARAVERSIEIIRSAPDIETGIAMLYRR